MSESARRRFAHKYEARCERRRSGERGGVWFLIMFSTRTERRHCRRTHGTSSRLARLDTSLHPLPARTRNTRCACTHTPIAPENPQSPLSANTSVCPCPLATRSPRPASLACSSPSDQPIHKTNTSLFCPNFIPCAPPSFHPPSPSSSFMLAHLTAEGGHPQPARPAVATQHTRRQWAS